MTSTTCYPDKSEAVDQLLGTLQHGLRREVLHYFENCADSPTTTFDELAIHVDGRVPDTRRKQLRIQLRHIHLPRLDADGWLDYDPRRGDITYHGDESARSLLAEVRDIF